VSSYRFVCPGCGACLELGPLEHQGRHPFACPNRRRSDGREHILLRELVGQLAWPTQDDEHTLIRHRQRLSISHLGLADSEVCDRIAQLDESIQEVCGRGFVPTPTLAAGPLAEALGLGEIDLWVKVEADNVAGSHKARHLAGVMLYLQTLQAHDRLDRDRQLAIASCGNAALAAATLARAVDWPIRVFVPPTTGLQTIGPLDELGAQVVVCSRKSQTVGDPCYTAFTQAVNNGALAFCCQGPDNALCIEGGQTLAYELVDQLRPAGATLDWLVIQVGGGALASACVAGLREAVRAGVLTRMPRICTVQTTGAWPLARAYHRLVAQRLPGQPNSPSLETVRNFARDDVHKLTSLPSLLREAAQSRHQWMEPWPDPPVSVAHGILDDETYDWFSLVGAMQETGGLPLVVEEAQLVHAQQAASQFTGRTIDATGAAGLAGVLELQRRGDLAPHQTVGVLLTGGQQAG